MPDNTQLLINDCKERVAYDMAQNIINYKKNYSSNEEHKRAFFEAYKQCLDAVNGKRVNF